MLVELIKTYDKFVLLRLVDLLSDETQIEFFAISLTGTTTKNRGMRGKRIASKGNVALYFLSCIILFQSDRRNYDYSLQERKELAAEYTEWLNENFDKIQYLKEEQFFVVRKEAASGDFVK